MSRQNEEIVLEDLIKQADEAYTQRAKYERVRRSIELLRLSKHQNEFDLAWRLGRACFFIGQQEKEAGANEFSLAAHNEGINASTAAVNANPERVEGHFWLGVNFALAAQARKSLAAIKITVRARKSLARAVEIDETYHAAGPLRVLGRWHHKAPRLCGARVKLAYHNYERAVMVAPENTVTRLYFAELLAEQNEHERAREHLEALLHVPADTQWEFETKRDQTLARQFLRKLNQQTI